MVVQSVQHRLKRSVSLTSFLWVLAVWDEGRDVLCVYHVDNGAIGHV